MYFPSIMYRDWNMWLLFQNWFSGFEVQEKVVCSGEDKASGQIMSMNKKTEQNDISLSSKETMLTNEVREKDVNSSLKTDTSLCGKLFSSFISLYRGWRHYKQYQVALSGLALAFLYFTVLGFDNITIGTLLFSISLV